jgi:C-terminal processing protease CtpA/Prc
MNIANNSAAEEGRAMYQAVWQDVSETFFDRAKLTDWAGWQHRFDGEIVDRDSARLAVSKMLASLGDEYTRLLPDDEARQRDEFRTGIPSSVKTKRLEAANIGYLCISDLSQVTIVEQVEEGLRELAGCDGYIIDLGDNGGGLIDLTVDCVELLMPLGEMCKVRFQRSDGMVENVLALFADKTGSIWTAADGTVTQRLFDRHTCLVGDKPIVVLMDGGTGSSAEVIAAALLFNGRKNGRAISAGKRTRGKGTLQSYNKYAMHTVVKITFGRFYSPDNVWFGDCGQTEANGLDPDIEAETFEARMEAAVAHLKTVMVAAATAPAGCTEVIVS